MQKCMLCVLALIASSCAILSLDFYMVNAQGDVQRYSPRSQYADVSAVASAAWISSMEKKGYISTSRAGDIGVIFHSRLPKVITVLPDSPALLAGVQNNDVVIAVGQKTILTSEEAQTALFGKKNESVQFKVLRANRDTIAFEVVRGSYADLRGISGVNLSTR